MTRRLRIFIPPPHTQTNAQGRDGGVSRWEARPDIFPSGLEVRFGFAFVHDTVNRRPSTFLHRLMALIVT